MQGDWRLIRGKELYDLSSDPEQRKDVAAQHPEVVAKLRAEYDTWWQQCSLEFHPRLTGAHRLREMPTGSSDDDGDA